MDSTQPKGKRPKLETTNKYNWKLHEMAIIWLNHNFEPKTSSPLSSVYRPGMNNQGEMRIYCDKSCSKRKIDDGFILERPDFFHLSGHAHKYHRDELNGYPCIKGRTSVDEIENSEALRYVLEVRDNPQSPVLVNGTEVIQDIKFKSKRSFEHTTEDADDIKGGIEVGSSVAVQGGKGNIRKRQLCFEDIEENTKIGAHDHFFLKEECDITITHQNTEIKRTISCSDVLIIYIQDEQLFAIPAVTENTACHYWTLLEPQQRKLFQDVRFFRIWMPKSGKFFCVHPEWTILKEDAPVKKSK